VQDDNISFDAAPHYSACRYGGRGVPDTKLKMQIYA
jgi:hypothetical protein